MPLITPLQNVVSLWVGTTSLDQSGTRVDFSIAVSNIRLLPVKLTSLEWKLTLNVQGYGSVPVPSFRLYIPDELSIPPANLQHFRAWARLIDDAGPINGIKVELTGFVAYWPMEFRKHYFFVTASADVPG